MASWLSSVIGQKAPIMSLTKFPLLVLHTEPSTSARPQTTGHCIKRKCSTYDANSINGYPPPLFQQSQHTIWPPWRNACTPLTTEMVKSTRTWTQPTKATLYFLCHCTTQDNVVHWAFRWWRQLPSKDQPGITNDFPPPLLDADNNDDNNGYDPQPCKNKNNGEFVEALEQLDPPDTVIQSIEENTQCVEPIKCNKRTRTQPWATEQWHTTQTADPQQLHRTKCIQPNSGGKMHGLWFVRPPPHSCKQN